MTPLEMVSFTSDTTGKQVGAAGTAAGISTSNFVLQPMPLAYQNGQIPSMGLFKLWHKLMMLM